MQRKTNSVPSADTTQRWAEYRANTGSVEALGRLIEAYLPFVHRILERTTIHLPSHIAVEDLLQAATLGVYNAISRYDLAQGDSFEAFAYPCVRGAILDELRAMDHLSRTCRTQLKKIESVINEWGQEHGSAPDEAEIAQAMGLTISQLEELLNIGSPLLSLDDSIVSSSGTIYSLKDIVADGHTLSPSAHVEREDMRRRLHEAFFKLTAKEQKILYLYYYEELRLSEIAQLYEVSEARICQIHVLAIAKLKATLRGMDKGAAYAGRH